MRIQAAARTGSWSLLRWAQASTSVATTLADTAVRFDAVLCVALCPRRCDQEEMAGTEPATRHPTPRHGQRRGGPITPPGRAIVDHAEVRAGGQQFGVLSLRPDERDG